MAKRKDPSVKKAVKTLAKAVGSRRKRVQNEITRAMKNPIRNAPMPARYFTTFKYGDYGTVTTSVADVAVGQVYSLNSLYDPDVTGTGHQPLGRDQLLGVFYNRYRVFAVSWKVVFFPIGGSGISRVFVIPSNSQISLSANAESHLIEKPRSQNQFLSTYDPTTFTGSVYLPSLNGVSRKAYASDDRHQAIYTTSPTEVMGLHIVAVASSGYAHKYEISITYHCELFDPIPLSQS